MLPSFTSEENDNVARILSACSGVESIYINVVPKINIPTLLPMLTRLPLTRLCCDLHFLFGSKTRINFAHPVFALITHLDVLDRPGINNIEPWKNLPLIPHLTHLSFTHPEFATVSLPLLRTCASLRVMLVMSYKFTAESLISSLPDGQELLDDHRFVIMDYLDLQKDWQKGAYTGINYWSRAEEFIAKRRLGEVSSPFYDDEAKLSKNSVQT
ncbi:hypothetical protein C8R47DRAFT_1117891 [Mycena vitilis]|nr:hypothetical protein C8R47DRAFT_1117891 [Mycena vitilis]